GKMLVLFETAAGYAMFKLLSDKKLKNVDNIYEEFNTAEKAQENLQLIAFKKFKSTADAVESTCALQEGKMNKTLKKLLKGKVSENEQLAVADAKLGNLIKEKLDVPCVHTPAVAELMRSIRANIEVVTG
ncbi:NOP5NT domain protein, partial [Ostertagia ostertagi]